MRSPRGGLVGQAPPRVRHAPKVRANSWEDVADLSASFGIVLDDWQENVLQAAMGERADGRWAARQVGLSTPRQNGKSQLIVARALAGVLLFNEQLIICSAHQQDTAREVFLRLVDVLEDNPSLDARVDSYGKALNREYIRFKSGQVIRFKARSTGGGRGFSADCLLLDEAQILSSMAWSAILPTMSARPNPQVWLLGTPPTPADDGAVFTKIRDAGLAGKESHLAYLEWSAEPDDDMDDPETWAKANPAYGVRIGAEAIRVERASMTDQQFGMERLGIWDALAVKRLFPGTTWSDAADVDSLPNDRMALGVEAAPDLSRVSISLAGCRPDGAWHVELWEQRDGSAWVAEYVAGLLDANQGLRAVAVDEGSPSAALIADLQRAGVRVVSPKVRELGVACAQMLEGIVTGSVRHTGQHQLAAAAAVAGKRNLGDTGMWVYSRRTAASDITPIQSATLALWAARQEKTKDPRLSGGRTESSARRAVLL